MKFEIDYEYGDVNAYYFDHREGLEIFYVLQALPEWEAQENLQWTNGDKKIELILVRLDDLTADEYYQTLREHPRLNARILVWDRKCESIDEIQGYIMEDCEFPSAEKWEEIRVKMQNYHKK